MFMKRVLLSFIFGAALACPAGLRAEESYKGRWEAGIKAGGIFFEGNSFLDEDPIYGGQVGYNLTQHWGLEASILSANPELQVPSGDSAINTTNPRSNVELLLPTLDLLYNFGSSRLRPYVAIGVGDFHLNPDSESSTYGLSTSKRDDFIVQYGAGLKWLLTQHVVTRIDLRHIINTEYDYRRAGIPENSAVLTGGLSWLFGGAACEAKPKPVKAVEAPKAPVAEAPKAPEVVRIPDSDGDGVADDKDECPNSPAGAKVDATGCPETVKAIEDTWVLKGVNFETASNKIKTESLGVLDGAAEILKARTKVRVEIQGHTDSVGKPDSNLTLSERRAVSVKDYLVSKGVSATQLETKGYGATAPIADNKTAEGRAQNRRIEFKVLSR
jgi:OOP family OmpA-OmpF porin